VLSGCRLYSRPCVARTLSKEERAKKRFDYFLLTRDPRKGKAVTGHHLEKVNEARDALDRPAIEFRLTKEGGELLHELTSENRPSGDDDLPFKRHLAVVVDGRIVTAATLSEPLR